MSDTRMMRPALVLIRFMERMFDLLSEHRSKGGWESTTTLSLDRELKKNIALMHIGIEHGGKTEYVHRKAANASNYLMMIADNYEASVEAKKQSN